MKQVVTNPGGSASDKTKQKTRSSSNQSNLKFHTVKTGVCRINKGRN